MEEGFAVTLEPIVALRLVDGLHVYVLAPLAVSVADAPLQIAAGVGTLTTGSGLTVTVTCVVAEQPLASVPVTVYVVVEDGLAVTLEPVVALRLVDGLHV